MSYNMMYGYGYPGMFGVGWISDVLIWVLIVAGIIFLVRKMAAEKRAQEKTPLEIIKERYARGELSKEEYEEKKRDLIS